MMNAFKSGLGAASRSKRMIFWLWALSFLLALTPTLLVSRSLEGFLGKSAKSEDLSQGYDDIWYREYRAQATALAATFDPTVVGPGALYNSLDDFLSGRLFAQFPGIVAIGILYILLWVFLGGGILVRYEEGRALSFESFMGASARFFWRFFRIFLLLAVLYYLVYAQLFPLLRDQVSEMTRETIDERIAFLWTALAFLIGLFFLIAVNLVGDYAKILTVLEKRRSALLALLRALRIVFGRFASVWGLYMALSLVGLAFMLLYAWLAPGAGQTTWTGVLIALGAGQLLIIARIWLRLGFYAGQLELCRGILEAQREASAPRPAYQPTPSSDETPAPPKPSQPILVDPSDADGEASPSHEEEREEQERRDTNRRDQD